VVAVEEAVRSSRSEEAVVASTRRWWAAEAGLSLRSVVVEGVAVPPLPLPSRSLLPLPLPLAVAVAVVVAVVAGSSSPLAVVVAGRRSSR
jgi:hypothetical protein